MNFRLTLLRGIGWAAGGRFLGQLVSWGVSILVMRLLDPSDYGLLAMATVLVGFTALFAEFGLGRGIVQAQEVDVPTLRNILGLVILVHVSLFGVVFAGAPLVAIFFGEERLTAITRVMAIQFLISAWGVIPIALLQRALEFKRRSIVDLSAVLAEAALTVSLAIAGLGVWALVFGSLVATLWRAAGIYIAHPFPHLSRFAFRGFGGIFRFGGYVTLSQILIFLQLQADMIIAGRVLGKEQVGYYSVSMGIASLPLARVSWILNTVAFPAFARIQDERQRVGDLLLRGVRMLSLAGFPVFWGIAAIAPEIVTVLLGSKWEPAIVPMQFLALVMPLRMVGQLMPPTLEGVGRADLVARNQLLVLLVLATSFLVGVRYGIIGLSVAWLVAFPFIFLLNLRSWFAVLSVPMLSALGAMARPALAGTGMMAAVAATRGTGLVTGLSALLTYILIGFATFTVLTLLTNRDGVDDVRALLVRRRIKSRPNNI